MIRTYLLPLLLLAGCSILPATKSDVLKERVERANADAKVSAICADIAGVSAANDPAMLPVAEQAERLSARLEQVAGIEEAAQQAQRAQDAAWLGAAGSLATGDWLGAISSLLGVGGAAFGVQARRRAKLDVEAIRGRAKIAVRAAHAADPSQPLPEDIQA
jgi:hypothetical protein